MNRARYKILREIINSGRWEIDIRSGKITTRLGEVRTVNKEGYALVSSSYNGKDISFLGHQVIMVAGGYDLVGVHVNHKNGIKTDNRLCNLEVATASQNSQHAWDSGLCTGNAKLTKESVSKIRQLLTSGESLTSLARQFGVTKQAIWKIKHNETWKDL